MSKSKEILKKSIKKIKVSKGTSWGDNKYGRLTVQDKSLADYIGKDVEIDIVVREHDINVQEV
jgi:hypothetical protein